MSRYLGLDWDHQELRVVEATVQGGKVVVRQALRKAVAVSPNPADPEQAGKVLREALNEAGIAPAPVLACIGRERVVLRDIRYPDTPPEQLPDLIRNQAVKELTFPAEEAVIDYSLLSLPAPNGMKRALGVVLRRELLRTYQEICKTAGLKLIALTPRPFGVLSVLGAQLKAAGIADTQTAACLAIMTRSAEFCVARGGELLFSRAFTPPVGNCAADFAAGLVRELKQSLAAYAAQFPQHPIRQLFVTEGEAAAEFIIQASNLELPIQVFDPLGASPPVQAAPNTFIAELVSSEATTETSGVPRLPQPSNGVFTGALGLINSRLPRARLPVDLLAPKMAPAPDRTRLYAWSGVAAAALLLLFGGGFFLYSSELDAKDDRIAQLKKSDGDITKDNERLKKLKQAELDPIEQWLGHQSVVLDELAELIYRFPNQAGISVSHLEWKLNNPAQPDRGARPGARPATPLRPQAVENQPIGQISFTVTADTPAILAELQRELGRGKQWWKVDWKAKILTAGTKPTAEVVLEVFRHDPREYPPLDLATSAPKPGPTGRPGDRRPR